MIGAQQVVDIALAEAARLGRADETIVLVTDRADASLRWAGNSMTTNGESVSRHTTVISIVRQGNTAHVGSVRSSEVDPAVDRGPGGGVAGGRARPRPRPATARRRCRAADVPADWDAPVPGTGAQVFAGVAGSLAARGFGGADQLYGYARHDRGDDVPGHLDRAAAALHPADRLGGDQRQTRRRQRVGGCQHARLRRCANRFDARAAVDAAGLGDSAPSSCPPDATRRSCRRRRWPT